MGGASSPEARARCSGWRRPPSGWTGERQHVGAETPAVASPSRRVPAREPDAATRTMTREQGWPRHPRTERRSPTLRRHPSRGATPRLGATCATSPRSCLRSSRRTSGHPGAPLRTAQDCHALTGSASARPRLLRGPGGAHPTGPSGGGSAWNDEPDRRRRPRPGAARRSPNVKSPRSGAPPRRRQSADGWRLRTDGFSRQFRHAWRRPTDTSRHRHPTRARRRCALDHGCRVPAPSAPRRPRPSCAPGCGRRRALP